MAQLKNTVVQGSLKVTDNIYSNTAQFSILNALTGASASTYGMGTDGQVLKSNGTNIYWSTETYTNVTQTPTTDNHPYEILFSYTNDNTTRTESTRKTDSLTYNPSTQALTIGKTNESGVFVPGMINGVKLHRYSSTELATGGWEKIGGLTNENKIMLVRASGAAASDAPAWMTSRYSTLLFFSYSDTDAFLQCDYSTPIISFGAGTTTNSTADSPNWYMKLKGTSNKTYTFPTDSKTLAANDGSNATGTWENISVRGSTLLDTVPIENGGTNATTVSGARENLGLRAENNSSSTLYLMGSVNQLNNANTYTHTYVYMKSGELSAKTLGVNFGTATTKIKLQWNNTENSLDFVFV